MIGDVDLVEVETCLGVDFVDVLVEEEYEFTLDMYGCFLLYLASVYRRRLLC